MTKLNILQEARLATAVDLTAAQIESAVALTNLLPAAERKYPAVLAAVIQALATNYAATVAADKLS